MNSAEISPAEIEKFAAGMSKSLAKAAQGPFWFDGEWYNLPEDKVAPAVKPPPRMVSTFILGRTRNRRHHKGRRN